MDYRLLFTGLLAGLCLSCMQRETDVQTDSGDVFYALLEQPMGTDTRVYADENLMILWHADDRVSVFDRNTYNQEYRFMGETGENAGLFAKVTNDELITGNEIPGIYAVYPYQASTRISNQCEISVTLPAVQRYADHSFGLGANTMVSAAEDTRMLFKNVGGYLVFKLYGKGVSVSSVELIGNEGEQLAGRATVRASFDGLPILEMQTDASAQNVTLTCQEPVVLAPTADDYIEFWFVLPPTTFTKGFTIIVTGPNGCTFEKSTSKNITIERNMLTRMSPVEVVLEDSQPHDHQSEIDCLSELYDSTGGDSWTDRSNWKSDKPVSEWYGVTTDDEGFVVAIQLADNNLRGVIPESIGNLSHLKTLFLKNNHISGPIPESLRSMTVWTESWGDILYGNEVTKSQFLGMRVRLPEEKKSLMEPGEYAYFLQWTPENGTMTNQEFKRDSLIVDSFKRVWYEGVQVISWCVNVPEESIVAAEVDRGLPWKSVSTDVSYPIHDYCPAWVLADPDGIIVDTNLLRDPSAGGDEGSGSDDPGGDPGGDPSGEDPSDLENKDDGNYPSTEGKIPDHHPLRISVSHDERLEFDSPRVDLDKKLAESVHISTNMNPSLVSFKFRSYCNWLLCVDKAIIVNGNPSVLPRSANLYLDVYYGTWRFKTIAIPVRQPGVQATIVTPSNVSSFELLNGINPGGYTVAFTPYAGSESFVIAHNGDEICDPLSSYANPTLLSGELFRTDQSLPEVNRVEKQEGEYSYTITYDSNRHTRLFKGCILRFIPVIIVIQDWNDIENSYAFYSVDDGTGFAYYLPVYALQTPVVLLTEYDSYLSEAIAEPLADPAGYNRLKAYSDIERRTVASDEIRVYSNVSWRLRDVSLENEFWQYTIKNGDLTVLADGKTIEEMGMNVYVNDYLKTKVDGKYRPNQSYPSRWTQLRVEVDLKDGLGATTVPLADIGQVGIPYTRFVNGVGTSCKEGEYPFNGHTYQFAVSYTVYLETESDHLTDIFTRNPSIHFQSSTGDCTISNWSEISKWATSISNTLYVDTDTDVSVTCDWKVPLSNYVEVYSQSSPVLNWELETHVVNRVESQVSERLYEGSRYNGKPLVNLSSLLGTSPVLNGPRNGPVKNEWHVCPSLPPLETGRWQNAGLARK